MSNSSRTDSKLVLGGSPRANLLPPEIETEEKAKSQRRGLFGIVALVVVVAIAAYAYSAYNASLAQAGLDQSNAQIQALVTEQAKYAEVGTLNTQLADIKSAEQIAVSTEIDWAAYTKTIRATLPAGAGIRIMAVTTATPLVPIPAPSVPLQGARVAAVALSGSVAQFPDISKWLDSLATIPGFADVTVDSITAGSTTGFTFEATLHLNQDALLNRFGKTTTAGN